MENKLDRLYSIPKVMEILSCSRSWAYRLIQEGKLTGARMGNYKGLRVTESSLRDYIRNAIREFQDEQGLDEEI